MLKAAIKNRAEKTAEGPAIPRKLPRNGKFKDPGSRAYPTTTAKVTIYIVFYYINANEVSFCAKT